MSQIPVIAIDGPGGSGKGTLARKVAENLNWHLLDSGALYRIVGCTCVRRGVDPNDEAAAAELAEKLTIRFEGERAFVDDDDITDEIRSEDGGTLASIVAAHPQVRKAVLNLQHGFRRAPGLVADGRDMGTVVFADAGLKIFLDASAEERAERRYKQLKNKGLSVSLPGLLEQITERDARDRGRAIAPLKPAEDAVVIDSTQMTIDEVVTQVMSLVSDHGFGRAAERAE